MGTLGRIYQESIAQDRLSVKNLCNKKGWGEEGIEEWRRGGKEEGKKTGKLIKFRMSNMGRIMFGVHKTKIHNTLLPWNYPTEIFAQGGQRDICKKMFNTALFKEKNWKKTYIQI